MYVDRSQITENNLNALCVKVQPPNYIAIVKSKRLPPDLASLHVRVEQIMLRIHHHSLAVITI